MQTAKYKDIPAIKLPSAGVKATIDLTNRYGPMTPTVLESHEVPLLTLEQGVSEGYLARDGIIYRLTAQATMLEPKSLNDLTEEELDFFVGQALGLEVYLVPIVPGMPGQGVKCLRVADKAQALYAPTVDWAEASTVLKHGVELLHPPPGHPWIAERGEVRISLSNPCLALCRCYVASKYGLDELYICNWSTPDGPD